MIKEIVCYKFPGFYESIFCNSDEFINDEEELKYTLEDMIEGNVEVEYEYEDFDKYQIAIGEVFMDCYVEKINEILPSEITDHDDFKFEKIDHSGQIDSPEYYNYRTDYSYCEVETNFETLQMIKDFTLALDGAEKYIKDHYTSCDGYVSFLSNSLEYWKSLKIEEYEENMLSALLDMLVYLGDCTGFHLITESTYYDVSKYDFAFPVVTYIGRNKNDLDIISNYLINGKVKIKKGSDIK